MANVRGGVVKSVYEEANTQRKCVWRDKYPYPHVQPTLSLGWTLTPLKTKSKRFKAKQIPQNIPKQYSKNKIKQQMLILKSLLFEEISPQPWEAVALLHSSCIKNSNLFNQAP